MSDCTLVIHAVKLASECHAGVARTDRTPYVDHCVAVATHVAECLAKTNISAILPYSEGQVLAAALLHDVPEDVPDRTEDVGSLDESVLKLTLMLRNPSYNLPDRRPGDLDERRRRKEADANHLAEADDVALLIKWCDRIHNCETAYGSWKQDRCGRYKEETKELLLPVLLRMKAGRLQALVPDLLARLNAALARL